MNGPASPPYRLRSRMLALVAVLVGLVTLCAAGLVLVALRSNDAIATVHAMELASHRAALLSVIVREQYIHEAHTIILRDRSHVDHHDEWVERLDSELDLLRQDVQPALVPELDAIHRSSEALRSLFARRILPAIDASDWDEVRVAHDEANELVDEMTRRADGLAAAFDARAVTAAAEARALSRLAILAALILAGGATIFAVAAGRALWRALTRPLEALEAVARKVEAGDRSARVAGLAARELAVVGEAVNRMLDALRKAEADLVESERLAAIGRVAAGVAHEVNNPIAVIRGYIKTMTEDAPSGTFRDELSILDEEAAACQRIAEDLLVYARSPRMAPQPVRADEVLEEARERSRESGARASGSPDGVRVDAEPAMIAVDPLRIRQVVVNLIKNAREASGDDEPVSVVGRRWKDGYRIEVNDRGRGMSEETRQRAFEPFFTTRGEGSGLGLAVCYGLVNAHGGTISVHARDGGGSRFVIDLPGVLIEEA